jgi:formylglycine-generating enzyme
MNIRFCFKKILKLMALAFVPALVFAACGGGGSNSGSSGAIALSAPDRPAIIPGDEMLSLNWEPVTGANAYEVWINTSDDSSTATLHSGLVTATSHSISELMNGTTYYLWLKAKNSTETSAFSNTAHGTPETFSSADAPGDLVAVTMNSITFSMIYANPFDTITFSIGITDGGAFTLTQKFFIGESEITFQLWKEVYVWATGDADMDGNYPEAGETPGASTPYEFVNAGLMGWNGNGETTTDRHPVCGVSWRDAIVWCNALTEYYNANNGTEEDIDCVYYTDPDYTTPLREAIYTGTTYDVPGSQDCPYIKAAVEGNTDMANCTATGFRLPASMEWEYAARWAGTGYACYLIAQNFNGGSSSLTPGYFWTPGENASGAMWYHDYDDLGADTAAYSWYLYNSTIGESCYSGSCTPITATHPVKTRNPNKLGLYDVSGSVWEWCFDLGTKPYSPYTGRVERGGSFDLSSDPLRVGYDAITYPYWDLPQMGLRVVRSKF